MTDPSLMKWFHGRITRDLAERCLQSQTSKLDGTYLLRESASQIGSYVLSVCKDRKVIHYAIQKQSNGMVGISDGPQFPGPVELVNYHKTSIGGLMTKLTHPCERAAGVKAAAYKDISHDDLDEATRVALKAEGIENDEAVRKFKGKIEFVVGNILHRQQPWFHGIIPRTEAERRLESQGCELGTFLIRERGSPRGSYVLGLCFQSKVYHYLFAPNEEGQLSIDKGRPFDNLMAVVNFYSQKSEGLFCTLQKACALSQFEFQPNAEQHRNVLLHPEIQSELRKALLSFGEELRSYKRYSASPRNPVASRRTSSSASRPPGGQSGGNEAWKYEKIYDTASVVKMEGFNSPFNQQERDIALDPNRLTLEKELGQGNFGSVMKGEYKLNNGRTIPVAVKTLKDEDIPNQRSEILKEADIMGKLDHPNIVRLIGVTQSPGFKIVMELAPQGPLHKYLKRQKDAPKLNILDVLVLMLQVDEGMDYLEKQHFVHRDLAARNVLVVSENFVKISDFGMSRAMGAGNEYYRAERAGKWPLKWYAPECIYFRKFTSKSDIWSYGITMWEAVSYGEKPYRGIKGNELVQMLDDGHRLPQPHNCPNDIYKLMKSCWEYKDADRPTFAELGILLSQFIEKNRKKTKR